jgi:putative glycosyltransferase (TIGR04348 family)
MRITLVTPAPPGSRKGNRITALRWARIIRDLGHKVAVRENYAGERCDVLLALHARRSHAAVLRFHREFPERPLIVALTGTDLYQDIHRSARAQRSLEMATRLVLLQRAGIEELPAEVRGKAVVIYQSAVRPDRVPPPSQSVFEVCVLGHLRSVKDPFQTAMAVRLLPVESRIRVLHVGGALTIDMGRRARLEMLKNPRYRWLGELPRPRALRTLARSRLLVLTSRMEGGANAICEALASRIPVISSRIAGSIGILGADYPGYLPVGDTRALAELLHRAETDGGFYAALKSHCRRLAPLVSPARERASWRRLLAELA